MSSGLLRREGQTMVSIVYPCVFLWPHSNIAGCWPLPEAFWPDVTASALPPRSAHPTLRFTCTNQEPMVIENLPFDKYELEPSPLTLFILGRKQPNYCWQVFIQGSTKNGDPGHPFGYLKVDKTSLVMVNITILFCPGCHQSADCESVCSSLQLPNVAATAGRSVQGAPM